MEMVCKLYLTILILYSSNVVWFATLTVALNVSTFERENDISITHAEWWRHKNSTTLPRHIPLSPKSQFWIDKIARKLAPFFSMISLWNDKCWTMGYDQGTCYSKAHCLAKGGTAHGYCAGGFGVCCVFSYNCGTATQLNGTYFTNPEFPYSSQEFTTCKHSVRKFDGVCQLRLDFDVFELDRPNGDGNCWTDFFHVQGADIQLPPLCGDLTGHHIYLPIGYDPEITFTFELNSQSPYKRWKILMTKIRCCSANMAPGGCLQHLKGTSGRVTSFNYIDGQNSNLNHLNYGVCVRREKGFCAIQWNVCHYHHHVHLDRRKRQVQEGDVINSKMNGTILAGRRRRVDWAENERIPIENLETNRGLQISRGYSAINLSGVDLKSRPNYFGNNQNVRCGLVKEPTEQSSDSPHSRRPRNVTLLQLISCPSDLGYYKLDDSWRPVPIDSSKFSPVVTRTENDKEDGGDGGVKVQKKEYNKIMGVGPIKQEHISHYGTKGEINEEDEVVHSKVKPWKGSLAPLEPPSLPEYKPLKLVKPSKLTTHHLKPQRRPIWSGKPSSHIIGDLSKTKPAKGVFVKPHKIKVKPKPKPWKGFGIHKHKHKARPRPRPKPRPIHRRKKPRPKPLKRKKPKRPKKPSNSTCKKKIIPIPFPIPILPVAVIPFPFGGGGGGGGGGGSKGGDDHDEGWGKDHPVISTVEPYLIRVATDSEREEGLSSFCMEWEQIPCEMWNQHPDQLTTSFYYDHDEM